MPPFTTSPAHCASRIVHSFNPANTVPSVVGDNSQSALTFNPTTLIFNIQYTDDLNLAGFTTSGTVYDIPVVGTLPGGDSATGNYDLTIKNPCFETSYV